MSIYLGLDLGEKRVGVARSDEGKTFAEALTTISYKNRESLARQLQAWVEALKPERIVVGFPETLSDEIGPAARKVMKLVEWLQGRIPGDWVLWDERFTTREAEEILLEADLSRAKRKRVRDRLAAQRILESYLQERKGK